MELDFDKGVKKGCYEQIDNCVGNVRTSLFSRIDVKIEIINFSLRIMN